MSKSYQIDTPLTLNGDLTVTTGVIDLTNGTSNVIKFGTSGSATPNSSGNSAGQKINLWNDGVNNSGFGVEPDTVWYSTYSYHKWYSQNSSAGATPTNIMTLDGIGGLLVSGGVGLPTENKAANSVGQVFAGNYSSSGGAPSFVGQWTSPGVWGIGPLTGTSDSTIKIGIVYADSSHYLYGSTWQADTSTFKLHIGGQLSTICNSFDDGNGNMSISGNATILGGTIQSSNSVDMLIKGQSVSIQNLSSSGKIFFKNSDGTNVAFIDNDGNLNTVASFQEGGTSLSSKYVSKTSSGQSVNGNFTILGDGKLWVGNSSAGSGGQVAVRGTSGNNRIQLDGASSGILTNVNAYIAGNGNATLKGTVDINTLTISNTSKPLVTNLNAEQVNGISEAKLAKNESIYELGGKGVQTGLLVTAQAVPNFTVNIASGTAYTDTGRRVSLSGQSLGGFTTASATYDRYDAIVVKGSSAGNNEATLSIIEGTPNPSPSYPLIPSDYVLLAYIKIRATAGTILSTDITDARAYRPVRWNAANDALDVHSLMLSELHAKNGFPIVVDRPFQVGGTSPWAISFTMPAGTKSTTWTHNLNLTGGYVIKFSSNSPDRHIYWQNKVANSVDIYLDDTDTVDIIIDAEITAL